MKIHGGHVHVADIVVHKDFAAIVKSGGGHFIVFVDAIGIFLSRFIKAFEFGGEIFFGSEGGDAIDVKWPVETFFDEVRACFDKSLDLFNVPIVYS